MENEAPPSSLKEEEKPEEDEEEEEEEEEDVDCRLAVGDRVRVQRSKTGTVKFVGQTEFSTGTWIGVELDGPDGKHDGRVRDVRYFDCSPRCGLFLRPPHVEALDPKEARSPDLVSATRVATEHKRFLGHLLDECQAQMAVFTAFDQANITLDSARDFLDSAALAPDPLRAIVDAHASRLTALLGHNKKQQQRQIPPPLPPR